MAYARLQKKVAMGGMLFVACLIGVQVHACCTAFPPGQPVLNADQTVLIIWDAAKKMQHFIRQASFKSDADDFGFLIPSPTEPQLDESGNEAFDYLRKLTEPEIQWRRRPPPNSKSEAPGREAGSIRVLQEKLVAGFHAAVLETNSTAKLVEWLKTNDYSFSPEIEAWALPYVKRGWKITALKVAKDKDGKSRTVAAGAFRMSFATDAPLFPYRESDPRSYAAALNPEGRLLRIYFIGDARYDGQFAAPPGDKEAIKERWTGTVAWAGKVSAEDRQRVLTTLKLPETTGPAEWHLTEFEDRWPYKVAPADVYFSPSANQAFIKRTPFVRFYDEEEQTTWPWIILGVTLAALAIVVGGYALYSRGRSRPA